MDENEELRLRSVTVQNAQALFLARERAELELLAAKEALEQKSKELENQREFFRILLTSIMDGVITTNTDGKITFLNATAESLTGWNAPDAIGQQLRTVFLTVDDQTQQPLPDPVGEVLRAEILSPTPLRATLPAQNGRQVAIEHRTALLRDEKGKTSGVVITFRDITDRQRSEEMRHAMQEKDLLASEKRFRLLVEGARDYAIFALNTDGVVVTWNEGAERIKGYRPEEIIGQHFSRFYPEEDLQQGKTARELEAVKAKGRFEDE